MSTSLIPVARLLPLRLWSTCQPARSFSVALGHNAYCHSSFVPLPRFTDPRFFQSSFCTDSKQNADKEDPVNNKNEKPENDEEEGEPKIESKEELLEKEVASLKEKLSLKDKDLTKAKNDVLRTLADMENLRTRSQRDNKQIREYAIQSFAKSLLEVADNLQLAVKNSQADVEKETDNKSLKVLFEGITLTEKTLKKAFEKQKISAFESLGSKFDPNRHDGLFQYPDPDREPGTVGNVLKEGYMIRDRVLRPAQVGTVQATPQQKVETPEESTENDTTETTTDNNNNSKNSA